MNKKKKATIQLVVLLLICGLIIWHAVYWRSTGMYVEMFQWLTTGKAYLAILYNLGVMLLLGTTLGFLMERIFDLISYKKNTKNT